MAFALNPEQQSAVNYIDGPLLVVAGAGSGKTRVITEKISYLVNTCGIGANHIYAITFTNKAAREMKERLAQKMGKEASEQLHISTFHTLGLNILKKDGNHVGLRANFTLFDEQDALAVVQSLSDSQVSIDKQSAQDIAQKISRLKSNLLTPQAAISKAANPGELRIARFYDRYTRQLRAFNAVDFDDLILLPCQLFQTNAEVRDAWQQRVHYLLVDEYQDTNDSQYSLIKSLVGVRRAITAVGDDDQSIYAWRGANPENIHTLQTDYPTLKVIKLEQNYRSSRSILHAANTLIKNNPHIIEKKLWSDLGQGDQIRLIHCADEEQEAARVVSEIVAHQFKHKIPFANYAILYRGNFQATLFEKECRLHRVPYQLTGSTSLFNRAEIKDALAYMRVVANPSDDYALLRIINTPKREIGPTTLEKLSHYAQERGVSLFSAATEMGFTQQVKSNTAEKLARFTHWVERKKERLDLNRFQDYFESVLEEVNYHGHLEHISSNQDIADWRWDNVKMILSWIAEQIKQQEKPNLHEAINSLLLADMKEEEEGKGVHLMTLHSSKGLEFPNVFLVGMEENLLPHHVSIEDNQIEEERRLAYVGITRAQQNLVMTLAKKRTKYGDSIQTEPSRFIDELPEDNLKVEGREPQDEAEQKSLNADKLSQLKAMLSKA